MKLKTLTHRKLIFSSLFLFFVCKVFLYLWFYKNNLQPQVQLLSPLSAYYFGFALFHQFNFIVISLVSCFAYFFGKKTQVKTIFEISFLIAGLSFAVFILTSVYTYSNLVYLKNYRRFVSPEIEAAKNNFQTNNFEFSFKKNFVNEVENSAKIIIFGLVNYLLYYSLDKGKKILKAN